MSDSTPGQPSADRNLLFSILALQMDFVSRDTLVGAIHAWVLDKARPLGEILVAQGALGPDEHELLTALVQKHLELNPDDARAWYLGATQLCRLGDTKRALEWADRALAIAPDEPLSLYNVACLYSLLGRLDQAVDCLENAVRQG